jgi:uncharacterized protein
MIPTIDSQWFKSCEANWGSVRALDIFAIAVHNQKLQGAFSLQSLGRVVQDLPEQPYVKDLEHMSDTGLGVVWFELTGRTDNQERMWLDLQVVTKVSLICQRCLVPFVFEVNENIPFHLVRRPNQVESEADDIDPDAPERLLGSGRFDLMGLIEDQIILGLPYVPKHDACPKTVDNPGLPELNAVEPLENEKKSPFHALKVLKKDN